MFKSKRQRCSKIVKEHKKYREVLLLFLKTKLKEQYNITKLYS